MTNKPNNWEEEFRQMFRPDLTGKPTIKKIIKYGQKLRKTPVNLNQVEQFIHQTLQQREKKVVDDIIKIINNI